MPKGRHKEDIEKADAMPTIVRNRGNPKLATGTGRRRGNLGAKHKHGIMSTNVGGEALFVAMESDADVLLVQEHGLGWLGLPGGQAAAMGKGWHGNWDPATANGNGRSGGTAVLTMRTTQIVRGGALTRWTIAAVSWTRRNPLHSGSVYNAHASDPADRSHIPSLLRVAIGPGWPWERALDTGR